MMEKLQIDQFTVMVIPPANAYGPVDGRKYTLTRTGSASHLLTIGQQQQLGSSLSDSGIVFTAEWKSRLGEYVLQSKLYGHEKNCLESASRQFYELQAAIPEILENVIKSDFALFRNVPWLVDATIQVEYESKFPLLRLLKKHGTPRKYLNL